MIYIEKEEPNEKIRLTVSTGDNFPIIGGATGKAYMAFLPKEKVQQIIEGLTSDGLLPKYTENTITDPVEFLKSLDQIYQEGVAVTNSEHTMGIYAISCPIFNSRGEVVLSIGVFIHAISADYVDIISIKEDVKKHAQKISEAVSRYI